jgi:hypothetical protein
VLAETKLNGVSAKRLLFLVCLASLCACSSLVQKSESTDDTIVSDTTALSGEDKTIADSLPQWAKQLGLTEPENLTLVREMSQQTSAENPGEAFNSVTLTYTGNYDTAMTEASRIAKAANLPLSKDFKALRKHANHAGSGSRTKGIAYMNYDLSTRNIDFLIYVVVDEKGTLTLSATDMRQMNEQLNKHSGIANRLNK